MTGLLGEDCSRRYRDLNGFGSRILCGFASRNRFGTLITVSIYIRERRAILSAIVGMIALSITASAFAFDLASILNNKQKVPDKFGIIGVNKLVSMMNDPNSHVNIYDANGWGLRSTAGVIPGAHLLSSDDKYDVAKELPADKSAKLVFYCADLH